MKIPITVMGPLPPPRSGTTVKNEILVEALEQEGIEVTKINTINSGLSLLVAIHAFSFSLERRNLIISVSRNGRRFLIPYAYLAKKLFRKNIILMPCGGTMPDELYHMNRLIGSIYSRACNSLDMIYVETQAMNTKLKVVLPEANIEVMFNFKPRPPHAAVVKDRAAKPVRLVYLGRMGEKKGIFYLIQAMKVLLGRNNVNVTLDYYGDFLPDELDIHDRFLRDIAGIDSIKYHGYLEADNINECLRGYDIFLFPTYHKTEGFPGVLIDAAYAGLAVIATDIAYNNELVRHGETGLLCQPENVDDLVKAIEYLCLDGDKRIQLGKNNWDKSKKYDSLLAANRIINLFLKH